MLYFCILGMSFAQLRWMTVADYRMLGTWVLLSWWSSLFPWLALRLVNHLQIKQVIPFIITVPTVWVSVEYGKAFLLTGFPWYFLAHSQHDNSQFIQCADFSGTLGVSFIVGLANGTLGDLFGSIISGERKGKRGFILCGFSLAFTFTILACGFGYGAWRLKNAEFAVGPTVALLQGNHPQSVRNTEDHFRQTWLDYKEMLEQIKNQEIGLIVWPETSFPFELPAQTGSTGPLLGKNDEQEIWSGPPQLLGVNVVVLNGKQVICRHNSSMLQDFKSGTVSRYDKIHRVPFGEYIPFKDWIPLMNWFSPYDFDYSIQAGEIPTKFQIDWKMQSYSFCSLLCFEDSDFSLTRWAIGKNGAPDFWVNQSNDGWFQGTEEHSQHLATARFRCVETGRSMVRAVNTGISAIIDPLGQVQGTQRDSNGSRIENGLFGSRIPSLYWSGFQNRSLILIGNIPIESRMTFYSRYGDWLPWLCLIFVSFMVCKQFWRSLCL
jgi:apolipoprotein N-acyltransferase